MAELKGRLHKNNSSTKSSRGKECDMLIADFMSENDSTRENARLSLVSMGEQSVGKLAKALRDKRDQVRWQAAKALGQIASPKAAPALVDALEDHEVDGRWLAAEALVAIGTHGLEPLLAALMKRPDSIWLRESAHHLLAHLVGEDVKVDHHLADHPVTKEMKLREALTPVIEALHAPDPVNQIPHAAAMALAELKRIGGK